MLCFWPRDGCHYLQCLRCTCEVQPTSPVLLQKHSVVGVVLLECFLHTVIGMVVDTVAQAACTQQFLQLSRHAVAAALCTRVKAQRHLQLLFWAAGAWPQWD